MSKKSILNVIFAFALLGAGGAGADEASIRAEMVKKFPGANVESVQKTPHLGLYEIVVDGQIVYADEKFQYLIDGNIIELGTKNNITGARQRELEEKKLKQMAFPFEQLPFDLAFKKVKGNGARKVAVFSDPDCPYCKRLERDLEKIDNVTIYLFLYPIEQLHPKAPEVSRAIWCSSDRIKAWDDYMLKGKQPKVSGECDNPVDKIVAFGQTKKISGTPTLFFADGKRVPGAIPADQIETYLSQAAGTGK